MRLNPKPAAASAAIAFFLLLMLDLTWPGHGAWLLALGIPLALVAAALWWRERVSAHQQAAIAGQTSPFANVGAYGLSAANLNRSSNSSHGVHLSLLLAPVAALAILLFVGGAVGSAEPSDSDVETTLRQDVTAIDRSRDGEPEAPLVSPQRPLHSNEPSTVVTTSTVNPPANSQQPAATDSAQTNTIVKPIVVSAPEPASSALNDAQQEAIALPQSANTFEYVVAEGDTLYDIAERYGSTVDELMEINQLDAFSFIHPGDVLLIPHEQGGGEDS